MEEKGRLIDLKEFLVYLCHRWLPILLVAVVFAAGMAGYSYRKQNTHAVRGSLNAVRTQNQTAFHRGTSAALYTDASAPAGTYNSRVRLYVDFDMSAYEAFESMDFEAVNDAFQKDFQTLAVSFDLMEEVIEELNLRDYDDLRDITSEDLRWMVNRNFEGAHVFNLVVTDTDPVRAQEIVTLLTDKLMDRADDYMPIRDIRILDEATLENEVFLNTDINKKQLIKYTAVGFVGGIIVAAIVYLIVFLVRDVVMCRSDVEYAGTHLFGNISRKKRPEEYKAISVCLDLQKTLKTIVIIPVDKKSNAQDLAVKVQDCLAEMESDVRVEAIGSIQDSADGIKTAVDSDAVLLTAKKEHTSVEKIAEMAAMLDEVHANILGTVLI